MKRNATLKRTGPLARGKRLRSEKQASLSAHAKLAKLGISNRSEASVDAPKWEVALRALKRSRIRRVSKGSPLKALDKLLHQVIKARDVTCQLAGAGMGKCGGHLSACHIYPKGRYQAMRYRLENVLLGCWRHHENSSPDSWHSNPMVYAAWFNRTHPSLAAKLLLMSQVAGKVDRKLDRLYLQAELKRYA